MAWTHPSSTERIRGRKLQLLRRRLFTVQPFCVACYQKGYLTEPVVRDHIIPLAEGGKDEEGNVQALCKECSDEKTRAESARGRRRGRM